MSSAFANASVSKTRSAALNSSKVWRTLRRDDRPSNDTFNDDGVDDVIIRLSMTFMCTDMRIPFALFTFTTLSAQVSIPILNRY